MAILAGRDILKDSAGSIKGNVINRVCRWAYKILSIFIIMLMFRLVPFVGIILCITYPLISCYLAILSRYYITSKDKEHFSEIVNWKNVYTLFLVDLTCIAISIVISLIVLAAISGFAAFYIFVSLLVITNVSVRLNAYLFAGKEI